LKNTLATKSTNAAADKIITNLLVNYESAKVLSLKRQENRLDDDQYISQAITVSLETVKVVNLFAADLTGANLPEANASKRSLHMRD
jgi:hypothetical protein